MIKVLVVDDSGVYRLLLSKALKEYSDVEIVGTAVDGKEAIELLPRLKPDVVTLDMNMPRMNGMDTLAVIAARFPSIKVVVVAAETKNDAERAVQVLEAGAFDFIVKPKATDKAPMQSLRRELYPKLKAAVESGKSRTPVRSTIARTSAAAPSTAGRTATSARGFIGFRPDIVAIGSSTGGPAALYDVLNDIPANFSVPIVVVQHMPKLFIESLSERLNRDVPLNCQLAVEGEAMKAGYVYFAPGEVHMEVIRKPGGALEAKFNSDEPEHHCRPAVDVTLRSLQALAPGVRTLVVILTGMGADGAAGAKLLSEANAKVIAQDKESSVVWGMPGKTVEYGAADEVLPLDKIGAAISSCGRVG